MPANSANSANSAGSADPATSTNAANAPSVPDASASSTPVSVMPRSAAPFIIVGGLMAILGGFVSAASAAAPSYTTSWAVAYIVLVAGACQIALGWGQHLLTGGRVSKALITAEIVIFNLANLGVLMGTIVEQRSLTYIGSALFLVSLVMFIAGTRGSRTRHRWALYAFWFVLVVLIVSVPVGIVIAAVRG